MPTKEELREVFRKELTQTINIVNDALAGKRVGLLEPVLARIGRGQQLPHWYQGLRKNGILPNVDGKTIGSVIEMLVTVHRI